MKCPHCIAKGIKSRVFPGPGSTTCLGWQPYYNEEGIFHNHDPNWHSTSYRCSNDHKWGISMRKPCPALDCEWAKDDVKIQLAKEADNGQASHK